MLEQLHSRPDRPPQGPDCHVPWNPEGLNTFSGLCALTPTGSCIIGLTTDSTITRIPSVFLFSTDILLALCFSVSFISFSACSFVCFGSSYHRHSLSALRTDLVLYTCHNTVGIVQMPGRGRLGVPCLQRRARDRRSVMNCALRIFLFPPPCATFPPPNTRS